MVLDVTGLTKRFESLVAVDDVSFSVGRDVLKAIIGPNGAGKTTLFNLLTGSLAPTAGTIAFDGEEITGLAEHEVATRGIGRSYQITNIFPGVTVRENVQVAVQRERLQRPWDFYSRRDELEEVLGGCADVLERVGLADMADRPAEELAHGDKRRLEIGITLATDPELLLLDEPTAGMSPEETATTIDLIRDLRTDHTILLIEHDMDVVQEVADEILVLHNGSKLIEGRPEDVMSDQDVQRAYLGGI
jgi:branched-chain amino acid transport system ATP-binding protein